MKINHIYEGDCIEVMKNEIDNNSIPLIFADPPYNLSGKSLNLINNTTGGAFYKVNERWDTYDDNEYITDPYLKRLQKITFDLLPKLEWDDTLSKDIYYRIHQDWKTIKFGLEHEDK